MAKVSFAVPGADANPAPTTLSQVTVAGAGLAPDATVTLSITATGTTPMVVSGPTDATGAISATIDVTDPVIQGLLPLLVGGTWDETSAAWETAATAAAGTITMRCQVA